MDFPTRSCNTWRRCRTGEWEVNTADEYIWRNETSPHQSETTALRCVINDPSSRGFTGSSCPGSRAVTSLPVSPQQGRRAPQTFQGGRKSTQTQPRCNLTKIIHHIYHHFSNSCAFKHSYFCGANLFVKGIKNIRRLRARMGGGGLW